MFTPKRFFVIDDEGTDFLSHVPFLRRARDQRTNGREEESKVALGSYLAARLIDRLSQLNGSEEDLESFDWQVQTTRCFLEDLPSESAEAAHLLGILEAAAAPGHQPGASLRMSLTAYSYYLDHEGRYEEALEVLASVARSYGEQIPVSDCAPFALFVGRLNRLLARWDAANNAYEGAAEAAAEAGDTRSVLLSRLGRANVLRGQGNLPRARAAIEQVIAAAAAPDLEDVRGKAYADLGVVLDIQGLALDSLQARYRAFEHAQDDRSRCRVLGDLGITLRDLGATGAARRAFEIVIASQAGFDVQSNAYLELMDLESLVGNRVAFERRRQEAQKRSGQMPPSMMVDFHYKIGLGLARFGRLPRARSALAEARALAEKHRLNEWYFRLDRVLKGLTSDAQPTDKDEVVAEAVHQDSPALAEIAEGLERYARQVAGN
ncbi:MAG: hypothetical protein ACREMO_02315 [Gemmatimonadales bacterium]